MKRLPVTISVLLFACTMQAQPRQSILHQFIQQYQKSGRLFMAQALFSQARQVQQETDTVLKKYTQLQISRPASVNLFKTRPTFITCAFAAADGKLYRLQLAEQKINTSGDFAFGEFVAGGLGKRVMADEGLHYRGCIQGDTTSMAALSVFENGDIMGLFAGVDGSFVLGKMKNSENYILYNADDIHFPEGMQCATNDDAASTNEQGLTAKSTTLNVPPTLCRKIRLYWELDYNLYRYNFNSNLGNVQNYATGLFNQVATMYQNEGITVELSAVYTWTIQDPYRMSTSSAALTDFRGRWNRLGDNFNGDLAHLISGGVTFANGSGGNGGVAYTDVLCIRQAAYGYSNVWTDYKVYPTFSTDVLVVTHEIGHNLGSRHTHWCGWNTGTGGTCGSIDDCSTPEITDNCSTCPATVNYSMPPLGFKGTVMSYCHLNGRPGTNLALGFGTLPQQRIRSRVAASACLVSNNYWTGAVDSLWSRSTNWSCGAIPNANTDVIIEDGVPRYPVITSTAVCRRLHVNNSAGISVKTGFTLQVVGGLTSPLISPPAIAQLFITGSATPGGLMSGGDAPLLSQQLSRVTNTLYEIPSLFLTGGNAYVFVPEYGSFAEQFGFTGTALFNNVNGDLFKSGGTFIKAPDTNGYYHIGVDFQRARFFIKAALPKVALPASGELFITGSAPPAGWMANGAPPVAAQKFSKISNTVYELPSVALTANASYLFVPVYGSFTTKYGGSGTNNSNNTGTDYFRAQGTDLKAPPVGGLYSITVDFQSGIFTLTKL
ncbi:MAG TPA: M12 family metallo-peptidase [Ferruginibacter sp.]|nr:M12 family metallo-peptidase [Ferruginibacter sp.]